MGVTADGRFVNVVRFDSEASARAMGENADLMADTEYLDLREPRFFS